jgi:hypothetical protein
VSIERRRRITAAWLPALLGGCLISTACGGSSHHSSTGNTASDSATRASHLGATSGAAASAGSGSAQSSGSGGAATAPSAGAPAAGGAAGANHSSPTNAPSTGAGAAPARASTNAPSPSGGSPSSSQFSPAVKQALNTFVACMHEHGANLPPPNTSGHGEVFNTNGIPNETLQSAVSSCEGQLLGILRSAGAAGIHGVEVTKR